MTGSDELERAAAAYLARIEAIPSTAWTAVSPCGGWTVDEVVRHVAGGNHMAFALLAGASAEDAIAARDVELDADLVVSTERSLVSMLAAFTEPGALERTVHHPIVDMAGSQLLDTRIIELVVHGWDIARSFDPNPIVDDDLAELAWRRMEPLAPIAGSIGVYGAGPSGTLGPDARPLQLVLDATGRRP
jgi:uncharacterized protein (TIGR03086 family)